MRVPVIDNGDAIFSLIAMQNAISAPLAQRRNICHLPQREILMFDGDPLHYHAFMRTFEHNVEERTSDARDYTSCHSTPGDNHESMFEAANKCRQIENIKRQRLCWKNISEVNSRLLQLIRTKRLHGLWLNQRMLNLSKHMVSPLRGCCNGMDGVEFMSELNIPANTVIVVMKLPYRLRDRWRAVASDIPETPHRRDTFPDIMAFTERQVKTAVEPVSGSIQDAPKTMQSKDVRNDH